jgi:hypothetical protein
MDMGNLSFWFEFAMTLTAVVGGVLGGAFFTHKKVKEEEKKDAEISPKFQQQQNIINDSLVALRVRTNADRVKIGQFHNGGKFLDGSPMKRFSITHESCDVGVPFEGSNLQNIVVTILWDLISFVKKNETSLLMTRDLPEGHFRSYNKSHGIDAFMVLPIKKHDLITGFIMVEWCDLDKIPDEMDRVEETVREYRSTIEVELLLRR